MIAVFTFAFAAQTEVQAQQQQRGSMDPVEMSKKQTERMKENLQLSEDQVNKVSKINLDFAQKRQELRKSASDDRTAMREQMEKIRDERNTELKQVLTAEQYKKFLTQEEEMRNNGGGKGTKKMQQ
jgi:Spy/CpxP family protein refolding chaperone